MPITVGVEEEFVLADVTSKKPTMAGAEVLDHAQRLTDDVAEAEMHRSQIEIASSPSVSLDKVHDELGRLRRSVIAAARDHDGLVLATGSHPGAIARAGRTITDKPRYQQMAEDYQRLADELLICGCHVHVGIEDPDMVIPVMNRARRWLGTLLALTANSPFWDGSNTGYDSFRTEMWIQWPTAGPPGWFSSRSHYDGVVDALIATGAIADRQMAYWDIRPSYRYPTVEFRVSDVCATVDEAVMLAGLCRAVVTTAEGEIRSDSGGDHNPGEDDMRTEMLRVSHWRAARSGLGGDLIDPGTGECLPAADMVSRLLDHTRDALEEHEDWDRVIEYVQRVLADGNGAQRQRRCFERRGEIDDVVSMLAEATAL